MALTRADVLMWREIAPLVAPSPRVLEIGQANWYGDVEPDERDADPDPFVVARRFYERMMPGATFMAIDKHGNGAVEHDLNTPFALAMHREDVVINTGTCEHVFNQAQVFKTIHEACQLGGLMVHAAPICGFWQHGFYVYNPTFFADLAAANGYEIVYLSQFNLTYGVVRRLASLWTPEPGKPFGARFRPDEMPRREEGDSLLYVVFRKTVDAPFAVPMQGRYAK